MPFGLFRRSASRQVIDRLHGEIVAVVRQPDLYRDYGVPDTFDGRFELLALVSTLFVRRLALLPQPGPEMAQDLTDAIFAGLDSSLREMGVGDLTVPKRIKKLAAALLGRRQAYEEGLRAGDPVLLAEALSRNVHGGTFGPETAEVQRLERYVWALLSVLQQAELADMTRGGLKLPAAQEIEARIP